MSTVVVVCMLGLVLTTACVLVRLVQGPSVPDRIVALASAAERSGNKPLTVVVIVPPRGW